MNTATPRERLTTRSEFGFDVRPAHPEDEGVLPYAVADSFSTFATVPIDDLLAHME